MATTRRIAEARLQVSRGARRPQANSEGGGRTGQAAGVEVVPELFSPHFAITCAEEREQLPNMHVAVTGIQSGCAEVPGEPVLPGVVLLA